MTHENINSYNEQPAKKLSYKEAIATFPEAKEIIPELINEIAEKRRNLAQTIGDDLAIIDASSDNEDTRYFWHEWVRLNEGTELQEVDKQLSCLHRLQNTIDNKPVPKGTVTDEMIEAARNVPITDIVGEPVRRSGSKHVCLCPLHDDHHPSMQVDLKKNRAWCYVCDKGGDSIALQMLITGCDFLTAVRDLAGGAL